MAFDGKYLICCGPASPQVQSDWKYRTTDALATVDTAAYFSVGYGLKLGDVIEVQVVDALPNPTSITATGKMIVRSVSATAIDVADAVSIQGANTD